MACPVLLDLVCDAVGSATSTVAGGVLSAIAGWVVGGASWLLDDLGKVITSTTTVNVRASWFLPHYKLMLTIAAVVAVPMLVLAAVQSVFQQNAGLVLRAAFVHLPLAGLLTVAAIQIVQLALEVTDALCTKVTTGTGDALNKTFHSIGAVLTHEPLPFPTFVLTVGALLIVMGAFVLWLELLVRAAAIYAAVFFLPLALASLIWPAVSHWCKRLTETLVALVLSKFVIVAVLSLAVGAVTSGNGFSTVLAGGALLLLASFTPFTLLRLIPLMEVGAAMQLEGARQRVRASLGRAPDSMVGFALRQAREHGAHRETTPTPGTPGMPGTGTTVAPGKPGPSGGARRSGPTSPSGSSGSAGTLGPLGPLGGGGAGGAGVARGSAGIGGTGGTGGAGGASAGEAGALTGGGAVVGGAAVAAGAVVTRGASAARGAATAGGEVAERAGGVGAGDGGDLDGGEGRSRRGGDGEAGGGAGEGGQLALGSTARDWPPPEAPTVPPGTIPIWPGSPESEAAALEATKRPRRVVPDGYGGVIPGVPSPLYGGTEPLSRFEPGPTDDWGEWDGEDVQDVQGHAAFGAPPSVAGTGVRGAPPFLDWPSERPDHDGPVGDDGQSGVDLPDSGWGAGEDWDGA